MGTLGAGRPGALEPATLTTPGAIEIHRRLAELRDAGFDTLVMEVSSQALDQRRIEGVCIDTAVFTNLSRDHLDYHPCMDSYGRAKGVPVRDAGPRPRGGQRRRTPSAAG